MDGKNHNFLLHHQYCILGYSYLSFVIKDKIESKDITVQSKEFDITPYNYIFNKSTSLIDSNLILNLNPRYFRRILNDIKNYDKAYLNQLNYVETNSSGKKYSSLHIAIDDLENDKDVDLILEYLCMTNVNIVNYKDVIAKITKQ